MSPVLDDTNPTNPTPSSASSATADRITDVTNKPSEPEEKPEELEGFLTPSPSSPVTSDNDLPSLDLPDDTVRPGSLSADSMPSTPGAPTADTPADIPVPPAPIPPPEPTVEEPVEIKPEPVTPPPQPEEKEEPELTPAVPPQKPPLKVSDKVLLTIGPLFLVVSLGVSALIVNFRRPASQTSTQLPAEVIEGAKKDTVTVGDLTINKKTKNKWDLWLANIPKNPDQVTASCLSTGGTLVSGQPTTCSDPQFTWEGAAAQESGTQIEGYDVYFGEDNNVTPFPEKGSDKAVSPRKMGTFQTGNQFTPQNLEKGKTYYLMVQTVSDSSNENYKYGADVVDKAKYSTRPANILFEYRYE